MFPARKKHQHQLPIVRVDNDISEILSDHYKNFSGNIFKMFVEYSQVHSMRATESGLKIKYHDEASDDRCNLFLGSRPQLGRLLVNYQSQSFDVFN